MRDPEIREFGGKMLPDCIGGCLCPMIGQANFGGSSGRNIPRYAIGLEGSLSAKVYSSECSFQAFHAHAMFDKWAAVEVSEAYNGPFETLAISSVLYVVFLHVRPAVNAAATFGYVYRTWLPDSEFALDLRPHFEMLPEAYDPFDPNAAEEIWVPVKPR